MEEGSLRYDLALEYARSPQDRRILPRVVLSVEFLPGHAEPVTVRAVLDTGAQVSVFDGNVAREAGWTTEDIVDRAIDVVPIQGIAPGAPIAGYVHEITGYLGAYGRFAELRLRVVMTLPGRIAFPVLGRSDFFEQVDVTFAERDRRLYFRFHDRSVLRSYA
jgi:hypothetical protein